MMNATCLASDEPMRPAEKHDGASRHASSWLEEAVSSGAVFRLTAASIVCGLRQRKGMRRIRERGWRAMRSCGDQADSTPEMRRAGRETYASVTSGISARGVWKAMGLRSLSSIQIIAKRPTKTSPAATSSATSQT